MDIYSNTKQGRQFHGQRLIKQNYSSGICVGHSFKRKHKCRLTINHRFQRLKTILKSKVGFIFDIFCNPDSVL